MKVVKKETNLRLTSIDSETYGGGCGGLIGLIGRSRYSYTFESDRHYSGDLTVMHEDEEAETIKEFRELNGLDKCDIVDFLNKNYKK